MRQPPVTEERAGACPIEACMMNIHPTSATETVAHAGSGLPPHLSAEHAGETGPPPPRTAVLLGLAFGASAGLLTVLYLLLL
jgi:hypothetical protein